MKLKLKLICLNNENIVIKEINLIKKKQNAQTTRKTIQQKIRQVNNQAKKKKLDTIEAPSINSTELELL